MFESKAGILLIGGVFFFVIAFLSNGVLPMIMYRDLPETPFTSADAAALGERAPARYSPRQMNQLVNRRVLLQFEDLSQRYPEAFHAAFGEVSEETCAEALILGRQMFVAEGCWHCHSQFVRPVSNESLRWGPVSETWEYQNELQRPVLFGTRRVGPDLSREGGRRGNDWQAVHLFQPTLVSYLSPMPNYPWFFNGSPDQPNRRGLAVITYVQWLGSWLESYPYYEELAEIKNGE